MSDLISDIAAGDTLQPLKECGETVEFRGTALLTPAEARIKLLDWLKPNTDIEHEAVRRLLIERRTPKGQYGERWFIDDMRNSTHVQYIFLCRSIGQGRFDSE